MSIKAENETHVKAKKTPVEVTDVRCIYNNSNGIIKYSVLSADESRRGVIIAPYSIQCFSKKHTIWLYSKGTTDVVVWSELL